MRFSTIALYTDIKQYCQPSGQNFGVERLAENSMRHFWSIGLKIDLPVDESVALLSFLQEVHEFALGVSQVELLGGLAIS